jgi:hypothetical protein
MRVAEEDVAGDAAGGWRRCGGLGRELYRNGKKDGKDRQTNTHYGRPSGYPRSINTEILAAPE